jgi:hypothetical protein
MPTTCQRCGRPIQRPNGHDLPFGFPPGPSGGERLYFVHDFLGCDTGCCGHRFYVVDVFGRPLWSRLMLDEHNRDVLACQATELARRFGVPVDWRACEFLDHRRMVLHSRAADALTGLAGRLPYTSS